MLKLSLVVLFTMTTPIAVSAMPVPTDADVRAAPIEVATLAEGRKREDELAEPDRALLAAAARGVEPAGATVLV